MRKVRINKRLVLSIILLNITKSSGMGPSFLQKAQTYLLVQTIIQTFDATTQSLKKDPNNLVYFPPSSPHLDTSQGQMLQGLRLKASYYPLYLETPWGRIQFRDHEKTKCIIIPQLHKATANLFKTVQTHFLKSEDPSDAYETSFEEIERKACFPRRLNKEGYAAAIGKQKIIVSYKGLITYDVVTVDTISCPTPIERTKNTYRSYQEITSELSLFMRNLYDINYDATL